MKANNLRPSSAFVHGLKVCHVNVCVCVWCVPETCSGVSSTVAQCSDGSEQRVSVLEGVQTEFYPRLVAEGNYGKLRGRENDEGNFV